MAGMETLQHDLARLGKATRLSSAVDNVDKIIEMLTTAREQVAGGKSSPCRKREVWRLGDDDELTMPDLALDTHTASLTMTKLQNPIKEGFEAVNDSLKEASKGQRNLGKALDKVCRSPRRPISLTSCSDQTLTIPFCIRTVFSAQAAAYRPRCHGRVPFAH